MPEPWVLLRPGVLASARTLDPPGRALRGLLVAFVTACLLAFALSANLLPRPYVVREGDVLQYSIRAPRKVSYVSQIRTRQARELAAAAVAPVVELDFERITQTRRALADLLQALGQARAAGPRDDTRVAQVRAATTPPLSDASARRLAEAGDAQWASISTEAQRVLSDVMRERIPDDQVETARQSLPLRTSFAMPEPDRQVVMELVGRFVRSNLFVNEEATVRARRDAQEAIAPVVQIYERGQTVVRDGQLIGPVELEALEVLGLRNPELDWQSAGAAALLAFTLVALLATYVWQFDRDLLGRDRRMILLALVLVVTTVAIKMIVPNRPLWAYVLPLPAVSMLLSMLIEARLGIMVGAVLAIILAWVAGQAFEIATIMFAGCTAGALSVWRRDRLPSYFLGGAYVFLAMLAVYVGFQIANRSDDWTAIGLTTFELAVNASLSALLAVGSLTLVGRLFGILTSMQLLELANPTQPLLRRLLMEAPGTYHHSIMVGNLGERAAEVIGADSLLVRVAAYYHDIGKLERPWAFIENQADIEENVHETLDPLGSATVIAAHVTDGMKLAEKYGLPNRICEIIPQHHGTRLISFFYQKAAEQTAGRLDPKPFTYPGPRPQSREAAILMLADSTEAAARAARDHSKEAIERLVEGIIRQRLEEGQFDDCNLTLRDLTRIKESFVTLLHGIYHPRIAYPPSATQTAAEKPVLESVPDAAR